MSIGEPRDCSSCHRGLTPNEDYYGGGLINFSLEDINRRLKALEDVHPKQSQSILDIGKDSIYCNPDLGPPESGVGDGECDCGDCDSCETSYVDDEDIPSPYPQVPKSKDPWVVTRLAKLEQEVGKARDLLDAAVRLVDDDSVGGCVAQLLKRAARILQEVCPVEE
jgi:hypothetical protein